AAIDAWRRTPYEAIFMDVQMPVLDGLEATRLIRAEESGTGFHIPIIAITAAAMESDYMRCLEAGMDGYLSKPIDFEQLDQLLEDLTQRGVVPANAAPRTLAGGRSCGPVQQKGRSPSG